jgi:H+/Cl- antiporter ClcA
MFASFFAPVSERLTLRFLQRQIFLWFGAVAIAVVAICFAEACTWGHRAFVSLVHVHRFLPLALTPLGFAALIFLTQKLFQGAEGSGIPQAIAAVQAPKLAERSGMLSLRVAFGKVLLTILGIACGASAGREGPTVQVGAAIMLACGRRVAELTPAVVRILIISGGAAGIAAAFNTPLAGVIFAIEELARSYEEHLHGRVLLAVIVAGIVSIALVGNYAYFGHAHADLRLSEAWLPIFFCGMIGGGLGGCFSRALLAFSACRARLFKSAIADHPVAFAAACGLILALLGALSQNAVFGTGYDEARSLLEQKDGLPFMFGLYKMAATFVSYLSGIPGGLFSPSLAVGAGLGSALSSFFPSVSPSAMVILGMVGYFTGVVQVPLTSIVIVMEMTDDQSLTMPLMVTSFVAYIVTRIVSPASLYRSLADLFLKELDAKAHDAPGPVSLAKPPTA